MVPFESLGTVCYSHSIVTMVLSCIISEIIRDIDRKSMLRVYTQQLHVQEEQIQYIIMPARPRKRWKELSLCSNPLHWLRWQCYSSLVAIQNLNRLEQLDMATRAVTTPTLSPPCYQRPRKTSVLDWILLLYGWKPILYWLFEPKNQSFRNKSGKTQPILSKFGIRGQVKG